MKRDRYVYVLFFLDGCPCYVGKGNGNRWKSHFRRSHNKQLDRTIKKHGELPVVIVRDSLTDSEAAALETLLIKIIGRRDLGLGPLLNHTDGGDGLINASPETRARMSASRTGMKLSDENRRSISIGHIGLVRSPEVCIKVSQALRGKPKSEAHRKAMSIGALRRDRSAGYSESHVAAISAGVSRYHENHPARWITDGTTSALIPEGNLVPEGWCFGRPRRLKK